jgi:SHS2 domain-containing protein
MKELSLKIMLKVRSCSGNSLNMLLYNFLEEVLYFFSCDPYMAVHSVSITDISSIDSGIYVLKATCHGEEYERRKHGSKTEIKAVTFSNMKIITNENDKVDIYIIFDI